MLRFSRGCPYRATDAQQVAGDACSGQVPANGHPQGTTWIDSAAGLPRSGLSRGSEASTPPKGRYTGAFPAYRIARQKTDCEQSTPQFGMEGFVADIGAVKIIMKSQ